MDLTGEVWQVGYHRGFILGPTHFVIYINGIDVNIISYIIKFADDTKVYGKVENDNNTEALQRDLHELDKWSEDWQMLFTIDKYKTLHVEYCNPRHDYQINNITLQQIDEEKYLGVKIHDSLKVAQQVGAAVKKCNQTHVIHKCTFDFMEKR
ncbi:uncharacterized protein [Procambarus clarkii]|uniref:uncharacterized protein n=1 Tax=Procambarus clarkii TaxID=6728 RepID=UPI003742B7C3